jgi:uncharacterized OsmC-like protein
MTLERIAAAMHRIESILRRRPTTAVQQDAPAIARWQSGMRVVSKHPNGASVATDMPSELGGTGDLVTPGWLWRAALGSCLTTRIVMAAAAEGMDLTTVEVETSSRSDVRGLLGMPDASGTVPCPAPGGVQFNVRIGARGASSERLHALIAHSQACSPMQAALTKALPVAISIEVLEG